MASRNLMMGIMFLSQTALGVLGNCACLGYFILTDTTGRKAKPTDVIVKHLIGANFMILLFKGIPHTMAAFGMIYFLGDVACKLIFYFYRVARGVSLGSISLLSIFQAILIKPCNSNSLQIKIREPKIIGSSLGLSWVLQLLLNAFVPMIMTDIVEARNLTVIRDFAYCVLIDPNHLRQPLYVFLLSSIDVLCVGLMVWASGSMVLVLWKHKQRVQHIHSSLSRLSSPETRATQSILALVSIFMLLYLNSSILTLCFPVFYVTSGWLVNAKVAMSACFPAVCPFVLLTHYTTVSKLRCNCSREEAQEPHIVKKL
uniref:vomeronasal type-1 receptor 4-like n=1 Tax=Jaculus jaculus TaxID=51337 RepID=UPI00033327CB|nr:vomeronasal type-1 receptor 4-like [Jaculus jaculus]